MADAEERMTGSNPPQRCVLILSDKSSGSSALQDALARHPDVRLVRWTPHKENETLFWMKAAAALHLPQPSMIDSTYIPVPPPRARVDLVEFLANNVPGFTLPGHVDVDVFVSAWEALCSEFAPVFVEKSPHHLHSTAALDLIAQADERLPHVDFRYVGLVRNPTDTLYSMWRRWRVPPERREVEWIRAYRNFVALQDAVGERCMMVRYEDLVSDHDTQAAILAHLGLETADMAGFHSAAVGRWRADSTFGYRPSGALVELAAHFGYDREDVVPRAGTVAWKAVRTAGVVGRRARLMAGRLRRSLQG